MENGYKEKDVVTIDIYIYTEKNNNFNDVCSGGNPHLIQQRFNWDWKKKNNNNSALITYWLYPLCPSIRDIFAKFCMVIPDLSNVL